MKKLLLQITDYRLLITLFFCFFSLSACGTKNNVPLPTEIDIVWNFLNLIKEGNIPEAVNLLDGSQDFDPATRQAWTDQLKNWQVEKNIQVTPDAGKFRVEWTGKNSGNTKWISVVKTDGQHMKIGDIATGP